MPRDEKISDENFSCLGTRFARKRPIARVRIRFWHFAGAESRSAFTAAESCDTPDEFEARENEKGDRDRRQTGARREGEERG